jgi:hypothetical protein
VEYRGYDAPEAGAAAVPTRPLPRMPIVRVVLGLALLLLAGCDSGTSGIDPAQDQREATQMQKNCSDPKWKEAHLGIWYSVCRPNDALQ